MPLPQFRLTLKVVYAQQERSPSVLLHHYFADINPAAITQAAADAMASNFDGFIGPSIKTVIGNDATYMGCHVAMNDNNLVFTGADATSQGSGTGGLDSLPPHNAVVIRKRTNQGGRTGYGRWFMGAIPENFTDGPRITPAAYAAYTTFATNLNTPAADALLGINWTPAHLSRKDNTLLPLTGINVTSPVRRQDRRRLQPVL